MNSSSPGKSSCTKLQALGGKLEAGHFPVLHTHKVDALSIANKQSYALKGNALMLRYLDLTWETPDFNPCDSIITKVCL